MPRRPQVLPGAIGVALHPHTDVGVGAEQVEDIEQRQCPADREAGKLQERAVPALSEIPSDLGVASSGRIIA